MSNRTLVPYVVKKLNYTAAGEKILVFDDPDDTNAATALREDGNTVTLNQQFGSVFINNISAHNCYFSLSKNIEASASAEEGVQIALPNDGAVFTCPGKFSALRIYLADAGDIYITLLE